MFELAVMEKSLPATPDEVGIRELEAHEWVREIAGPNKECAAGLSGQAGMLYVSKSCEYVMQMLASNICYQCRCTKLSL